VSEEAIAFKRALGQVTNPVFPLKRALKRRTGIGPYVFRACIRLNHHGDKLFIFRQAFTSRLFWRQREAFMAIESAPKSPLTQLSQGFSQLAFLQTDILTSRKHLFCLHKGRL
jgi:hypothetical protein